MCWFGLDLCSQRYMGEFEWKFKSIGMKCVCVCVTIHKVLEQEFQCMTRTIYVLGCSIVCEVFREVQKARKCRIKGQLFQEDCSHMHQKVKESKWFKPPAQVWGSKKKENKHLSLQGFQDMKDPNLTSRMFRCHLQKFQRLNRSKIFMEYKNVQPHLCMLYRKKYKCHESKGKQE